jgi:ZIP family zinc transporter
LIDYLQVLLLGAFAGLTIFLGLPLAVIQSVSSKKKGFLNAVAIGILIFLTVDVLSHAWESATYTASRAFVGKSPVGDAALDLLAMFGGMAIGLLGLTWYGTRYMKETFLPPSIGETSLTTIGNHHGQQKQEMQLIQQLNAYRLSMMIAIGIGVHNFSEGLAIGQSYASGAIGLAVILIIGFGAHNATEGFGIAGPLTGLSKRPSVRFLALAGLVGGGPTFMGTVLGSLWTSTPLYIVFLSIAGGALIYVSMLMYNSGRRQTTNAVLMVGFFVGLFAGFITDLIVTLGGA